MSAEVIPFPVVPLDPPARPDEPIVVVTDAVCRMNLLMAVYQQPGPRPSAHNILMQFNDILEEPALCEAVGIEKISIKEK
jgi:hypothetical protein